MFFINFLTLSSVNRRHAISLRNHEKRKHLCFLQKGTGSDLSSRAVSSQVLSALESLTAVFGMGTGGTSPSLPPVRVQGCTLTTAQVRFNISDLQLISLFSSRSLLGCFRSLAFPSLFVQALESSPRPISINNLHVLPHFQR